ncbi:phosphate ABC transporter substrate-binding protein PstS [Thiocapsa bogorovii]|uniref:phosphate ABC transporter substrate-binding protein PstS n=1 Tax=Thiocapsa bogorovii TaxID=521689 RepID=UPI001E462CA5|nr:phosphate ABC transporter substrate-binding protein PstS [Thiocapsa bogorovii]UHD16050.1 phosphate ABC transporter substrate-binding protein PstS [Thiocapsa bogorovii]
MPLSPALRVLALAFGALVSTTFWQPSIAADPIKINGAGASFPAPLYQRWFRDYFLAHPNIQVDYQPIGSGPGVNSFIEGRLDFAGSDQPLTDELAQRAGDNILQLPLTAGAVVLTYNLPGIDALRLSREALAGIFLGSVARWNDPLILAANPGVEIPDVPIVVVTRVDASGTSLVMTRHLSAISEAFAKEVGVSMSPDWPALLRARGGLIRGSGNGGVAAFVQATVGAIGYVQYSYAHLPNMQMASIENREGDFVSAGSESFRAAIEAFRAKLDPSQLSDPEGAGAYPILSLSWLVMRSGGDDAKSQAMRDVVRYALVDGQADASKLGYIPLSEKAVSLILEELDSRK